MVESTIKIPSLPRQRRTCLILNASVVASVTLILSGCSTKEPPGQLDFRDTSGYMRRLSRSQSPEAIAIKKELADAPAALKRELDAAQAEGIPINAVQLQTPPVPRAQNAAPIYSQLGPLFLKARGITPAGFRPSPVGAPPRSQSLVEEPMSPLYRYSAAEISQARAEMKARAPVLNAIRAASEKPYCDFQRNWSLGPAVLFPEYAQMRGAARLLNSETYLLARDGRYKEAVREQARGFRIAEHAGADPILIGYLVAIAIDAITLRGFDNILQMAGPNPELADLVRTTIATQQPAIDIRHALGGEAAIHSITVNQLRQGAPKDFAGMIYSREFDDSKPDPPKSFSPEEREFVQKLLDAALVHAMHNVRESIRISERPFPERLALIKKLWDDDDTTKNPIVQLSSYLAPVLAQSHVNEARAIAIANAVMAGAAVLAYKGRHAAYPERLEQALSPVPPDPFTGKPLKYRRYANGFVVYSVGEDGKFDGGKPGDKREGRQSYFRYPGPGPIPHEKKTP